MKDYLIIDNFFDNAKHIREFALKQNFYTKENHPYKETLGNFSGNRTDFINNLNKDMWQEVSKNILSAISIFLNKQDFEWVSWISFSYTDKNITLPAWHIDGQDSYSNYKNKIAGVVYLNQQPIKNSGTLIKIDNEIKTVENIFNRLIIYPTNKEHTVCGSFGETKNDSRLVMTIFFYTN